MSARIVRFPRAQSPADTRDCADLLVRRMRTRTEAGRDAHGRAFRPYTPRYARVKDAAMHTRRADR